MPVELGLPAIDERDPHPAVLWNVDEARFRPDIIRFNDVLETVGGFRFAVNGDAVW